MKCGYLSIQSDTIHSIESSSNQSDTVQALDNLTMMLILLLHVLFYYFLYIFKHFST